MVLIDYFSIVLNKPIAVFQPGEIVQGNLNLKVKERFKINSLNLVASGTSEVHWITNSGINDKNTAQSISDTETFLSCKLEFMSNNDDKELYIEVGTYTYPFMLELPENLPTSFEHSNGFIRYSIIGNIDIPWAVDKQVIKPFTVIYPVDLNSNPSLDQSYSTSASKVLCCGMLNRFPIVANLSLPKLGFVSGEPISYTVNVYNNSPRSIKEMELSFFQQIKFSVMNKVKIYLRKIHSIKSPRKIEPKSNSTWDDTEFVIPTVCPSINGLSNLIQVTYGLVLNFDASGVSMSTDLALPIVIGTVLFEKDQSKDFIKLSYQSSPTDNQNKINLALDSDKVEAFESESVNFNPLYPFYKGFSNKPNKK